MSHERIIELTIESAVGPSEQRDLRIYRWMSLTRAFDDRMLKVWKQGGGIGGTFSQRGHEAISVGSALALGEGDVIAPMHRDLGAYLVRGLTPERIWGNLLGKAGGVSGGRDSNLHGMGDVALGIVGFISHLPHSLPVALGAAEAFRHRQEPRIAMTYVGDGGASTGLFHEVLNMAALWQSPLVVIVENNQYAFSTPLVEQTRVPDIALRADGYGIPAAIVDGNDVQAVLEATEAAVHRARGGGGPTLIETKTMRMLGHAIHDGAEYVPPDLLAEWAERDPVRVFAGQLMMGGIHADVLAAIDREEEARVATALQVAREGALPDAATVTDRVYATAPSPGASESSETIEMTYLDAIRDAMSVEMQRDDTVLIMGEDVGGTFGGAFKATRDLAATFGHRRVRNMPLAELGFTGVGTGMALFGLRPVIEMQFADFISSAFDSIVQFAATNHYRWGGAVPWVIRAPSDGGISSGPFHSQNPEAWFVHTPGLKVVAPATPADAKGLLAAAIRDPNPVIFFEAKTLYRSVRGPVPTGEHVVPIGKARVARAGRDLTIITYGAQVHEAMRAADALAVDGIEAEVLDLRSLKPLDTVAVMATVERTGKVLVVHSANRMAGVGAEISAWIHEEAFDLLDAPVCRIGAPDTPVPFSPPLEAAHRPDASSIEAAARDLAAF